jgi:hypothetical protein
MNIPLADLSLVSTDTVKNVLQALEKFQHWLSTR